ncbi:MAG TPA: hypothetical protein VN622_05885 [Clostridia bacterium]|nr:hypothetical protein [Clostridia bacterium]
MSYVVPEDLFESKRLAVLLDRVVSSGGNWERMFGGVLVFHVPPSEEPSIIGDMNAVLDEAGLSPRGGSRKDGV